jgi:hypothetical protein
MKRLILLISFLLLLIHPFEKVEDRDFLGSCIGEENIIPHIDSYSISTYCEVKGCDNVIHNKTILNDHDYMTSTHQHYYNPELFYKNHITFFYNYEVSQTQEATRNKLHTQKKSFT